MMRNVSCPVRRGADGKGPGHRNLASRLPYNPYAAPSAPIGTGRAVGVRSGLRADLRDVAVSQKGILLCLLAQFGIIGLNLAVTLGGLPVPPAALTALAVLSLVI